MDIVVEILLEVYMELMLLIVPEKRLSKKHIVIAKIIAALVVLGVFALVLWGVWLIADLGRLIGILPIVLAVLISLAQIVGGIILYKKNHD